jgi:phospholipase C
MRVSAFVSQALCGLQATALSLAVIQMSVGPTLATAAQAPNDLPSPGSLGNAQSPIKHVIVIIGENRSFDHVFATYQPTAIKGRPQEVLNLLSEGIVSLKGTNAVPGPNWRRAVQKQVASQESVFTLSPPSTDYTNPAQSTGRRPVGPVRKPDRPLHERLQQCIGLAEEVETGLPDASYYASLASGGTGLTSGTPDTRIQWATAACRTTTCCPVRSS